MHMDLQLWLSRKQIAVPVCLSVSLPRGLQPLQRTRRWRGKLSVRQRRRGDLLLFTWCGRLNITGSENVADEDEHIQLLMDEVLQCNFSL